MLVIGIPRAPPVYFAVCNIPLFVSKAPMISMDPGHINANPEGDAFDEQP